MSSQDSGTVSKSPGVGSPAVALPHKAFRPNSGVSSTGCFAAKYDAVMQGQAYKQVDAGSSYMLFFCLFFSMFACFGFTFLVLPFWCRLTQVVVDKIQEGRKMAVCLCVCLLLFKQFSIETECSISVQCAYAV